MNLKRITSKFNRLHLTLALSYGSRNEILNALRVLNQKNIKNINEKTYRKTL